MKDEEILALPFDPQSLNDCGVMGFTFGGSNDKRNHDSTGLGVKDTAENNSTNKRYKTFYSNPFHRTWCEVEELYQRGFYNEALDLFKSGHGGTNKNSFLIDKEVAQLARIKAHMYLEAEKTTSSSESQKESYEDTVKGLLDAIFRRSAVGAETLHELLWTVLDARFNQLCPLRCNNFSNVGSSCLVEAGNVWLSWFELWSDYYVICSGLLPSERHRPQEFIQRIAVELAQRKELAHCRTLTQRALALIPLPDNGTKWVYIYLAIDAECAEATEDVFSANEGYTSLQMYHNKINVKHHYDEFNGMGYTSLVENGTLAQRIDRTRLAWV